MSIESELLKEGIHIIKKIHPLNVKYIATSISKKLVNSLPGHDFNYDELVSKISKISMYIAKIPNGVAAKYFYKNNSIYFSETADLHNLNDIAIHECIHALQSVVDSKNELIKLGLCDFTDSKLSGMALNEAAVQLMTMKCRKYKFDTVKYFDIELPSNSPDYYPLECNLVRQMAYITGEHILYNSTLYGNDDFKNKFIALTSKNDFEIIKNNINHIMYLEDKLYLTLDKIQNITTTNSETTILVKKANRLKRAIKKEFLMTQNKIFTSFFDKLFNFSYTEEQIQNFRQALYTYRKFIGVTDTYTFFNEYYINKMVALEEKSSKLNLALIPFKETMISRVVKRIKLLIGLNENLVYNNIK